MTKTETAPDSIIRVARGGGAAFFGRLFSLALNYALAVILARGLGAEGFGLFIVGTSLANLMSSVSLMGLNRGTVRFVAMFRGAGDKRREIGTVASATAMISISGLVSALCTIVFAESIARLLNLPMASVKYLWGFAIWIPIWALLHELAAVLEALRLLGLRALTFDIGWPLTRTVLTVGVLMAGGHLAGVIGANIAASFVILVVMGAVVARVFVHQCRVVNAVFPVRRLLAFSAPIMAFNILNITQTQVEIYLLSALVSVEAAGFFSAAARTAVLIVVFLEALGMSVSPLVSHLANERRIDEMEEILATTTRWSFTLGLPAAVVLLLFGRSVLGLFGNEFVGATSTLYVLVVAQLVNSATGPVGTFLTMSGYPGVNMLNSAMTLGISLISGILLIPKFGIVGGAVGAGLSVSFVNTLRAVQVFRIWGIQAYSRRFFKPLASAGIGLVATYTTSLFCDLQPGWQTLVVGALIFLAAYVATLISFGLDASDLLVLDAIKTRISGMKP